MGFSFIFHDILYQSLFGKSNTFSELSGSFTPQLHITSSFNDNISKPCLASWRLSSAFSKASFSHVLFHILQIAPTIF